MGGGGVLNREQKIVLAIGASLVVLGVFFLVLQLLGIDAVGRWVPLLAGVIALVLALLTRVPGFTFLGSLLLFGGGGLLFYLYLGQNGSAKAAQAVLLLFVSMGLCISPVLTRFIDRKILLWPLLPGIAGLVGGIVMLI